MSFIGQASVVEEEMSTAQFTLCHCGLMEPLMAPFTQQVKPPLKEGTASPIGEDGRGRWATDERARPRSGRKGESGCGCGLDAGRPPLGPSRALSWAMTRARANRERRGPCC